MHGHQPDQGAPPCWTSACGRTGGAGHYTMRAGMAGQVTSDSSIHPNHVRPRSLVGKVKVATCKYGVSMQPTHHQASTRRDLLCSWGNGMERTFGMLHVGVDIAGRHFTTAFPIKPVLSTTRSVRSLPTHQHTG